jgi:hypothetical protein
MGVDGDDEAVRGESIRVPVGSGLGGAGMGSLGIDAIASRNFSSGLGGIEPYCRIKSGQDFVACKITLMMGLMRPIRRPSEPIHYRS